MRLGDAHDLAASLREGEKFDFIYCRWVLCWLKEPEKALSEIYKALKPGGKLILHDYFNWRAMTTGPRSAAVDKMVQAAINSFEDHHGDVEICGRMLKMLRTAQLNVSHFDVYQRVARGGGLDSTIHWPLTWWRTYGPKLVQLNKLTQQECEAALNDLAVIENDPDSFVYFPPLFEFIAYKDKPISGPVSPS